jgi:hypothetical protein
MAEASAMAGHVEAGRRSGFFAARWRGEVSLERLFFFDMLLVATAINVAAAFVSIMMFGFKLPAWAAVAAFLAPVPYNIFLVSAIWRATEGGGSSAAGYRLSALVWLILAVVI